MNVGPTGDGRIAPVFEERLRQFGSWMSVNGEAVYATKPWRHQNDTVTPYVWCAVHRFCHLIIIIIIIQQFIRCRNMSESLQVRRTTSNANTWVANSYMTRKTDVF